MASLLSRCVPRRLFSLDPSEATRLEKKKKYRKVTPLRWSSMNTCEDIYFQRVHFFFFFFVQCCCASRPIPPMPSLHIFFFNLFSLQAR